MVCEQLLGSSVASTTTHPSHSLLGTHDSMTESPTTCLIYCAGMTVPCTWTKDFAAPPRSPPSRIQRTSHHTSHTTTPTIHSPCNHGGTGHAD